MRNYTLRNVQSVGGDRRASTAETRLMDLGGAIKAALGGRTQQWLADAVGIDASAVTRLIAGQMKDVTLERVVQIEDALELPRGAILRAAGYVDEIVTPEDALRSDTSLSPIVRRALIAGVEAARGG